jgi:hypothetical protein
MNRSLPRFLVIRKNLLSLITLTVGRGPPGQFESDALSVMAGNTVTVVSIPVFPRSLNRHFSFSLRRSKVGPAAGIVANEVSVAVFHHIRQGRREARKRRNGA